MPSENTQQMAARNEQSHNTNKKKQKQSNSKLKHQWKKQQQ